MKIGATRGKWRGDERKREKEGRKKEKKDAMPVMRSDRTLTVIRVIIRRLNKTRVMNE